MKEIKFRCKNKVGNWCFFTVLHNGNINEENFNLETLSQFTGLKDKNGVDIYDGDIIKTKFDEFNEFRIIIFDRGAFVANYMGVHGDCDIFIDMEDYEINIIGNIYDNTELLEIK